MIRFTTSLLQIHFFYFYLIIADLQLLGLQIHTTALWFIVSTEKMIIDYSYIISTENDGNIHAKDSDWQCQERFELMEGALGHKRLTFSLAFFRRV